MIKSRDWKFVGIETDPAETESWCAWIKIGRLSAYLYLEPKEPVIAPPTYVGAVWDQ